MAGSDADVRGPDYELVRVRSGAWGIRSAAYGEICHPGVGPGAEAEALYVEGLNLRGRMKGAGQSPFVVWDVGLGGGANALAVIDAARDCRGTLRLLSFDRTLGGLEFALLHAAELGYLGGLLDNVRRLLGRGEIEFRHGTADVSWRCVVGDFPSLMAGESGGSVNWSPPHAILYDPHSPAANPEMWTLPLFQSLAGRLDPERPCALATYSRSTAVRTALLVAGFYVGTGARTATKEETTLATNRRELATELLGARWLSRARRSRAAEPWTRPPYGGRPLSEATWMRLQEHPQFRA